MRRSGDVTTPAGGPLTGRSPRVVMILANDFTHDTRVYKEARSLIAWGLEVQLLAMPGQDVPVREICDGIHIQRIDRPSGVLWRIPAAVAVWWSPRLVARLFPEPSPARPSTIDRADKSAPIPAVSASPRNERPRPSAPAPRQPSLIRYPMRMLRRAKASASRLTRRTVQSMRRTAKRLYPTAFRLLSSNVAWIRHARALSPDVVVCHDLNTLMAGAIVKRITGASLVYDSHELYLERNLGAKSRGWDKAAWAPIELFCIRQCDAVFTVADGISRHLARQYAIERPHLLRNVQPYEPPPARTSLLADELGIPGDRAVVLYPGAITINRGLETMIDSAPLLKSATYVIMGYARNAAYLESLHKRARDLGVLGTSVLFRDAVPIGDVVRYTASADLGIVPTQRVCLSYEFEASNKIFHCLMAGVPLVMSNHIEKRVLAERYGIGVLFDETDPRSIAAAVNDTLADPATMAHMRQQCFDAARTLNWEHEEHTYRSVFKAMLGEQAPDVPEITIMTIEPKLPTPTAVVASAS